MFHGLELLRTNIYIYIYVISFWCSCVFFSPVKQLQSLVFTWTSSEWVFRLWKPLATHMIKASYSSKVPSLEIGLINIIAFKPHLNLLHYNAQPRAVEILTSKGVTLYKLISSIIHKTKKYILQFNKNNNNNNNVFGSMCEVGSFVKG